MDSSKVPFKSDVVSRRLHYVVSRRLHSLFTYTKKSKYLNLSAFSRSTKRAVQVIKLPSWTNILLSREERINRTSHRKKVSADFVVCSGVLDTRFSDTIDSFSCFFHLWWKMACTKIFSHSITTDFTNDFDLNKFKTVFWTWIPSHIVQLNDLNIQVLKFFWFF